MNQKRWKHKRVERIEKEVITCNILSHQEPTHLCDIVNVMLLPAQR